MQYALFCRFDEVKPDRRLTEHADGKVYQLRLTIFLSKEALKAFARRRDEAVRNVNIISKIPPRANMAGRYFRYNDKILDVAK